ncbi:MAG TPA: ATP-NAD kinase family protein [Candidatus Bathyarchaeia archaeon]|nr:ATP-NAD kinase family protein [Candidatus Bathyarchaeia archaeon]
MHKVGFLVNPIAGMGGAVGLKGTDGKKTLREAIRKGARPVSPEKGLRFLEEIQRRNSRIEFLVAPGSMGETVANQLKLEHKPIGQIGRTTDYDDSIRITRQMRKKGTNLIVFCGGDGTARDVLKGVSQDTPVLGVPTGVKIYSSVFAINPTAAAESTVAFLEGKTPKRLGEVVDVDEAAFRKDRLSVKLFGYLTTPDTGPLMQGSKSATGLSEDAELDAIAEYFVEEIEPDSTYILGPGSTVERIARRLGVKKTLLGVDAARGNGKLLGQDMNETSLLSLVNQSSTKIVISPIGGQGYLFGRGNQQISPEVIRRAGVENIMVVGSRSKIEALYPRRLLTDSGDEEMDRLLRGYRRVITGYAEEMVVKVE